MTIAVTGASGQLGAALIRRLLADRHSNKVVSIDLRPPPIESGKLFHIQADITTAVLTEHLRDVDTLIHLAFLVSGHYSRTVMESVNVEGSKRVFTQAVDAGVRHLIFASSVAAYGVYSEQPVPIVEDTPRRYQPDFGYAATKFQVEDFLDDFERQHPETTVTRLRPALIIGPFMDHPLQDLLRRGWLPHTSGPIQVVWEDDVVEAFVSAAKKRAGGAYNLGSEDVSRPSDIAGPLGMKVLRIPRSLSTPVAAACSALSKVGLAHSIDPAWLRHGDTVMVMSSNKARSILGWTPRYNTVTAVLKKYLHSAPRKADLRLLWFMKLAHLGGTYGPRTSELSKVHLVIQLDLMGKGGGRFTIQVSDGKVSVKRKRAIAPDGIVTLDASLFKRILAGKTSWSKEQLVDKIRAEGQAHSPMVVAGIIATYRSGLCQSGLAGMVSRLFAKWVEAGSER